MLPENGVTGATRRETGQRVRWFKLRRCSVCRGLILRQPVEVKEPVDAPEPRQEWVLCKGCHEALVAEMERSSVRSPVRMRIAIGLVAAERSPRAYTMGEREPFQREFVWFMWLLVLFTLFHAVLFVILFTVPR